MDRPQTLRLKTQLGHRAAAVRLALLLGVTAVGTPLASTASTASNASTAALPAREVVIRAEHTFDPVLVVIDEGESVLWRNDTVLVHSITAHPDFATTRESFDLPAGAAPFHSGLLIPGDAYTHTFEVPGTYRYFCAPHERARSHGWVEVRPRP
jgi:plastocyanin